MIDLCLWVLLFFFGWGTGGFGLGFYKVFGFAVIILIL